MIRIAKNESAHHKLTLTDKLGHSCRLILCGPSTRGYIWVGSDDPGKPVYAFTLTPRVRAALRKALR